MSAARKLPETRRCNPSIEIRVWMLRHQVRAVDLARELGVTRSAIANFIDGKERSKSRRIRDLLLSKGCPEELLMELWGEI